MTEIDVVLTSGCLVSLILALATARTPDIGSLSRQERMQTDFDLRMPVEEQRRLCKSIAWSYRHSASQQFWKAFSRTLVATIFVVVALAIVAAFVTSDVVGFARLLFPYLGSKFSGGLGWLDGSETTTLYGEIGWAADLLITFTINVLLGSWLIFLVSFGLSLAFASMCPVRWVKLVRVERYWIGDHNKFGLLFRRMKILASSRQRLAPRPGDFLYGDYEVSYNPPWYLRVLGFFV